MSTLLSLRSLRAALVTTTLALASSGFALGCSSSDSTPATDTSDNTEAKSATLRFNADEEFSVDQTGELVEDGKVTIVYDTDRLPECRGDFNGKPAWTIGGHYRLNDGAWKTFEAGGFSPTGGSAKPILTLSEPGSLEIYFEISNRWGCHGYDSNYGDNYTFEVRAKGGDEDGGTSSSTGGEGGGDYASSTSTSSGDGGGEYGSSGSVGGGEYGSTGSY